MYRSHSPSVRPLRRGFTLLEVLLVLGILVVIATLVVPNLIGEQQSALEDATRIAIRKFEADVQKYSIKHSGKFPEGSTEEVVKMLMSDKDEDGKKQTPILNERPLDGWKRPLQYEYPSNKKENGPAIWSEGANTSDNSDNITNYEEQEVDE